MRYVPSATVLSMVVYGASGLAFVGANLLLARVLSTEQYALLTLLVALITLGQHLAPMGLDAVVTRGRVDVGPALLKRVAAVATGVGVAVSITAFLLYGLSAASATWLLVGTAAGGLMLVAGARFQSQHRFLQSLALVMSQNLVLLLGAVVTIAVGSRTADLSFHILTVGLGLAAGVGWVLVLRERRESSGNSPNSPAYRGTRRSRSQASSAAGMLFIQLERLVIPHVLTVADLALFGVLGAIAGSVFRVLQMGVGFSLLPRLRSATTVLERRELIARELRFAIVIAAVGAVSILALDAADRALVPRGQVSPFDGTGGRCAVQRRRQDRARIRPGDGDGGRDAARARTPQRRRLGVGGARRRRRVRRRPVGPDGRHLRRWPRLAHLGHRGVRARHASPAATGNRAH